MAYSNALPAQLEYIPYYDKIGHVVLYGIAAYLGERLVRHRRIRLLGKRLPLFVTLFSLFVVAEELVQQPGFGSRGSGHGCDRHCDRDGVGNAGPGLGRGEAKPKPPLTKSGGDFGGGCQWRFSGTPLDPNNELLGKCEEISAVDITQPEPQLHPTLLPAVGEVILPSLLATATGPGCVPGI